MKEYFLTSSSFIFIWYRTNTLDSLVTLVTQPTQDVVTTLCNIFLKVLCQVRRQV